MRRPFANLPQGCSSGRGAPRLHFQWQLRLRAAAAEAAPLGGTGDFHLQMDTAGQQQPSSLHKAAPSDRPAGASPLQRCLAEHGFSPEDLAAFDEMRHRAYSQEFVEQDVRPKLADLRAEGLTPHDVAVWFA
jgi:hypothetical protein